MEKGSKISPLDDRWIMRSVWRKHTKVARRSQRGKWHLANLSNETTMEVGNVCLPRFMMFKCRGCCLELKKIYDLQTKLRGGLDSLILRNSPSLFFLIVESERTLPGSHHVSLQASWCAKIPKSHWCRWGWWWGRASEWQMRDVWIPR